MRKIKYPLEEVQEKINRYFADCDAVGKLYGEAGLALAIGVTLTTLRRWCDGTSGDTSCPELKETVQMAYLRIQDQIESGQIYQNKGMVSKSIFLLKQARFGGYQDRIEAKQSMTVNVKHGKGMDDSDFK